MSDAESAPDIFEEYVDIMTDIKTMAVHTSNSPLLSFAFVPFKMNNEGVKFGTSSLVITPFGEQVDNGRLIDTETQKWWGKQTPAAREHWINPDYKPKNGVIHRPRLSELPDVLKTIFRAAPMATNKDPRVWANGIVFDIGNLENLVNMEVPWLYNSARDMRTMTRHIAKVRGRPSPPDQNAHNPIADCINQIWSLWEIWPTLDASTL